MFAQQQMLVQNKTVADSGWFDAGAFVAPISLTIQGMVATDVVQIYVSNANAMGATDVGTKYGADITADGKAVISESYRWIRIARSAIAGSGIVNVGMFAQRQL